jgi:hypothetical protein
VCVCVCVCACVRGVFRYVLNVISLIFLHLFCSSALQVHSSAGSVAVSAAAERAESAAVAVSRRASQFASDPVGGMFLSVQGKRDLTAHFSICLHTVPLDRSRHAHPFGEANLVSCLPSAFPLSLLLTETSAPLPTLQPHDQNAAARRPLLVHRRAPAQQP